MTVEFLDYNGLAKSYLYHTASRFEGEYIAASTPTYQSKALSCTLNADFSTGYPTSISATIFPKWRGVIVAVDIADGLGTNGLRALKDVSGTWS